MSNSPTKYFVVDDTSPRVQYEGGSWSLSTSGVTDAWGINGPTHNRTLHELTGDGSFSFKFNGTTFEIRSTIDTSNSRARPSWLCSLDGRGFGRVTPSPNELTNHWVVCSTDEAIDGSVEHTLKVDVQVPSGAYFGLDEIIYSPNDDTIKGETLMIQDRDNGIAYSPAGNWNATSINHITDIPDSSVTFKFRGTGLTFYAFLAQGLPSSSGKYSIDGGPETAFAIPGVLGNADNYNVPLFSVNGLSPQDEHTVTATYSGKRGDTPLALDFFEIASPPQSQSPAPSGTTGPSSIPSDGAKGAPVGAIVGGVVGGVVGLALVVLVILFFLRRKNKERQTSKEDYLLKPEPLPPQPPQSRPSQYDPYDGTAQQPTGTVMTRKQQEAMESYQASSSSGIVHVDSGFRMPGSSTLPATLERPPVYTED